MMNKRNRSLIFFVLILVIGCASLQPKHAEHLRKDKYKWENREKALKHYSIDLNRVKEYYLIETFVAWNRGHWGCFYIGNKSYCFSRSDSKEPILFKEFKYNDFILESLKMGNIDTLQILSQSLDHRIISPASNFILTKYKNNVLKSYTMPAFDVEADLPPNNF